MSPLALLYAAGAQALALLVFAVVCGLALHFIEHGALRLWRRYQRR